MTDNNNRQARFEKLLDNYAVALHLTYRVLDSGLLEKKIKVGNDVDKITSLVRHMMPAMANDIRYAEKIKGEIKNTDRSAKYHEGALDIANAYFYELNTYGGEWEYADLEELFTGYKEEAEEELKEDQELGY